MNREPIVFVVEDDEMARHSLQALIAGKGQRVEVFASAEELLAFVGPQQVGCVVTDLRLGGMNGLELQQQLAELDISLPVIVITGFASVPVAVRAMSEGAFTLLEKPFEPLELINAVERALERSLDRLRERERVAELQRLLAKLTADEREVLDLMVKGASSREIAIALHISPRTCDRRRRSVLEKMNVNSVPELATLVAEVQLMKARRQ